MLRVLVVVVIVGIIALAFFLGWFNVSAGGDQQRDTVQFSVDKGKMKQDTQGLRSGAEDLARTTRERARDLSPSPRPDSGNHASPSQGASNASPGQDGNSQVGQVQGTVRAVDPSARRLTVTTLDGREVAFDVTSSSTIRLNEQSQGLEDLQPGDRVGISWKPQGDRQEALVVSAQR